MNTPVQFIAGESSDIIRASDDNNGRSSKPRVMNTLTAVARWRYQAGFVNFRSPPRRGPSIGRRSRAWNRACTSSRGMEAVSRHDGSMGTSRILLGDPGEPLNKPNWQNAAV